MTVDEYLDLVLSEFRNEMLKSQSLTDYYKSLPAHYSPTSNFLLKLHQILLEAENTPKWISLGEKAPSYEVVKNMMNDRTKIRPLYKEAWSKALNCPLERIL